MVDYILKSESKFNNDKQIVLLLCDLSAHPQVRHFFRITGLIDSNKYSDLKAMSMSIQMKHLLQDLSATESTRGRASDENNYHEFCGACQHSGRT